MKVIESGLGGVLVFEPAVHGDERGFFFESYREDEFRGAAVGLDRTFVQDNWARSSRGVGLRGLHYQLGSPQAKLVRVLAGEIFDVAVDVRRGRPRRSAGGAASPSRPGTRRARSTCPRASPTATTWLSAEADVFYKCTEFYAPLRGAWRSR